MRRLATESVEVVVDTAAGSPAILYWGAPLGDVDPVSMAGALERPRARGAIDVTAPLAIVAEHASGYAGRPGLLGNRPGGRAWAPRFTVSEIVEGDRALTIDATDAVAELGLRIELRLEHVLTIRATLTNTGSSRYLLAQLLVGMAVPDDADELLWFTGRWSREFHETRSPFTRGVLCVENRSGRSTQEHLPLVFAGRRGFGEWSGEVRGLHLGASGNHQMVAEVLPDGRRMIQFGELLHPGEVVLEPGEQYVTPTLYATYSAGGLTPASWGFHRHLRSRPAHPRTPRPVLVNTWEAVYFNHDLATLRDLADRAAAVGCERYVLDDGWFGSRRDDTSGLGDWTVSPDAHPSGLAPIIDHVHALGMQFGIWVEPEMVNPDSDLYRAHPDWALTTDGYTPVLARNQLVLNLAHPGAYATIRDALVELLAHHDIQFVKWDMNRHHVQGSGSSGSAGTHAQTSAVYRLLDELRARFPGVEIESCSSGGGRVDFGILEHTDRVWTSDCNDALERHAIQRGASMFLVPELLGAHIGPPQAHTTGRTHTLDFRAITALMFQLGIEWNLLSLTDAELDKLAGYVALHRRFRPLLHGGDVVRFDPVHNGDRPSGHAYGVYATDRSEALICYAQLTTGDSLVPHRLVLPGLDARARYRVAVAVPVVVGASVATAQPGWLADGITLTGRQLGGHGLQLPALDPESAVLLHLSRLDQ